MKRKRPTNKHQSRPPRRLHIRADLREEPDEAMIAQAIVDLSLYLAQSGKTFEQHEADRKKHQTIYNRLFKVDRTKQPRSPLPGCECRQCLDRGSNQLPEKK